MLNVYFYDATLGEMLIVLPFQANISRHSYNP